MAPPKKKQRIRPLNYEVEEVSDGTSDEAAGSSKDKSCLLEAEPSKEFTGSTLNSVTSSPIMKSGKRSFKKLSVGYSPIIPINDDCSELSEEKEHPKEKTLNKTADNSSAKVDEQDMSIVKAMSLEQMQEHVACCLQLSSANKITTKNAFALKLIDCLSIITKNDSENNFAAMACQLDAGANIYSHRVDAVHQQVMSLVETCMLADKRARKDKKGNDDDDDSGSEDGSGEAEDGKRQRSKKKKVIARNMDISRLLKTVDPRDAFVRVDALPGEIFNNARLDPSLALTLERSLRFWSVKDESYKALCADGTCSFQPALYRSVIKRHTLGPAIDLEAAKQEPYFSPPSSPGISDHDGGYEDFDNEEVGGGGEHLAAGAGAGVNISRVSSPDKKRLSSDLELITIARSRMMMEGSVEPSRLEVMKALFHKPDESDYHYLKMDNSQYWVGPEYWKRPLGPPNAAAANRKLIVRKKKDPVLIEYGTPDKTLNKSKPPLPDPLVTRKFVLNSRTISNWSKKKVTYPADIHFELTEFLRLFNIEITPDMEEEGEKEATTDLKLDDDEANEDLANDDLDNEGIEHDDSFGAAESQEQEAETNPLAERHDEDVKENLVELASGSGLAEPNPDPNTEGSSNSDDCYVYEGDNLVPMVKTVKVDPIRYVAKPNRVDIQHLKETMMSILKDCCGNKAELASGSGLAEPNPDPNSDGSSDSGHDDKGDNLTPMVKTENNENGDEGSVTFGVLLEKLFASPLLERRTRDDLSVPMAFLCLLTLTNEHNLRLQQPDNNGSDLVIRMERRQECSIRNPNPGCDN